MAQAPGTNSLRAMRTFADDIRRVQGATEAVDTQTLTTATSVVAPTVNVRSVGPIPEALTEGFAHGLSKGIAKNLPRQAAPAEPRAAVPGVQSALQDDLMDIRNVAGGTEEATIVSERTKRRWSFTGAVKESMSSWWKDTLADIKEDTSGGKTLPGQGAVADKRARIVRAASMDGRIAPKEDVPSFVKAQQTTAAATPPAPETAAPSSGWTHVDTPAPLPTAPLPEPTPKLARPVIRPLTLDIAPARPVVPPDLRQYSSAPVETPSAGRDRAWAEPEESSLAPQVGIDETLRAREQAIQSESAKFAARAREAAQRRKDYEATQEPHSGSRYFVYGTLGIIGLSLVVLAGVGGYAFFMRGGPVVDAPTPGISMLFSVSESVGIPLISDRNDFMFDATNRVNEAQGAYGAFVRYYLYYQSDRTQAELPAQAFLDILDLRAPGSFLRTIEPQMMFGTYVSAPNAPFIVFKVRNFEDALGGMLLFEPNLNSDLAPLMGQNLSRDGQVGSFRDEVISGVDARSLYDDYGNRVMMYSFIDQETLVITTSPAALVALSQVLK